METQQAKPNQGDQYFFQGNKPRIMAFERPSIEYLNTMHSSYLLGIYLSPFLWIHPLIQIFATKQAPYICPMGEVYEDYYITKFFINQ